MKLTWKAVEAVAALGTLGVVAGGLALAPKGAATIPMTDVAFASADTDSVQSDAVPEAYTSYYNYNSYYAPNPPPGPAPGYYSYYQPNPGPSPYYAYYSYYQPQPTPPPQPQPGYYTYNPQPQPYTSYNSYRTGYRSETVEQ